MDQYIYIYISIWSIPLGSDVQQKHRFFSHSSHAASYIYRSSSDASSCFCWTSIYIGGSWFHITCGSLIYYCYHQNQKGCLSPQGSLNCKDLAIRLNWHDLANFLPPNQGAHDARWPKASDLNEQWTIQNSSNLGLVSPSMGETWWNQHVVERNIQTYWWKCSCGDVRTTWISMFIDPCYSHIQESHRTPG